MNMNNYSVDEGDRTMLNSFRLIDLQTLLRAFGLYASGQKSELKDQALELLRTRPAYINIPAYIAKIYEIYRSLNLPTDDNSIILRSLLQKPSKRIYQPLQYPQQSTHMVQAELPQVMPTMQRGMYGNHISNSIPANNMVNNNTQYIAAGNYQPSRTSITVSYQLSPKTQISIVAQDALGLGTSASGNNSCTPSIETVAQIKFKKLPFYEVIDEVIKPTLLTGTGTCTLLNVSRDMKEDEFKHTLSLEHVNLVATNRDISQGKNEYRNQFQIRICQLIEPVPNESPDYMPLGLHIRVGGKACPLPPTAPNTRPGTESRQTARPINCTEIFKLSPIVANNITINWIPDGKKYVFAMFLVKKLTVDTLINKLQDKGGRISEGTRNYIIQKLADNDPDLATTSYRVSLVCPLSKTIMKIPAKSINCDHLQCFDARTFLLMNEKKPTWMCPTCNKLCLYDDIEIENYFLEVLSSSTLNNWSKEIEILADGTWKAFKETKSTSSSHTKVKHIDCVDLDSNDEEPPTKRDKLEKKNQVQPQQAGTSSEQGVVIEID